MLFIREFGVDLLGEIHVENNKSGAAFAFQLEEHETVTCQFDSRKVHGHAGTTLGTTHLFADASQYLVQ